jgi:ADP-heptose:LPS heptosyltransferase
VISKLLKFPIREKDIKSSDITPGKIKKILIVKQHHQLGDMLCTYPIFAAIKKKLPDSEITLVASPYNHKIIDSRYDKYIDDILIYDKFEKLKLIRFLNKLRKKKFDLGIVPSTVSVSRTSHIINYLSGAKIKVGVKSIDGINNKFEYLLNIKNDFDWRNKIYHQTEKNLDIVRQIGFDLNREEIKNLKIPLSDEELDFARKQCGKYFSGKNKLLIGIHPGAGKPQNRWKAENFAELMKKMSKKYDCHFFCTSGPMDNEVIEELKYLLSYEDIKFKIFENLDIRKSTAIISLCNIFITNDTGLMHIAGMMDVKVLSLFAETKGYEWAPMRKGCIYIQSKSNNINEIEIKDVYENAIKLIEEKVH